jgi:mannose-6-phosphate isomerase-like protein (cupin superfamily)
LYVLEGEVEFVLGEDAIPAGAGSCAYAPRGALHAFKNVGTSPSRVLVVYSPGGFEKFFLEAGESAPEGSSPPQGEPDVGRIVEIGR